MAYRFHPPSPSSTHGSYAHDGPAPGKKPMLKKPVHPPPAKKTHPPLGDRVVVAMGKRGMLPEGNGGAQSS